MTVCTGPAQDQTGQNPSMDEGGAHMCSHLAEELPPTSECSERESLLFLVSDSESLSMFSSQQPDTMHPLTALSRLSGYIRKRPTTTISSQDNP